MEPIQACSTYEKLSPVKTELSIMTLNSGLFYANYKA